MILQNRAVKLNAFLKAFLFIYLFTILSGAVRKWFITDKQIGNLILFLQILVPFSLLFVRNGLKSWRLGSAIISILGVVFFIGIFNPLQFTFYHSILGFFLHSAWFFLLLFYMNNREKFDFGKLFPFLVGASIFQIALVFFQYTQPPDAFINTYADVESVGSVAIVGNAARVTGTFSYISGFTGFLFFHSLLVWAMVTQNYYKPMALLCLFGGLIACFMSGARAATYLYGIVVFLIFLYERRSFQRLFFNVQQVLPLLVLLTVLLATSYENGIELITNAFTGFFERRARGIESGEEAERIFNDFFDIFYFKGQYPYFGVGLGTTYQGANKLFGTSPYVLEYGFFESEIIRIILEGGFLLLFVRAFAIIWILKHLYIPKFAQWVLALIIFFFYPIVFNLYNSVFCALGLMLLDKYYYLKLQMKYPSKNRLFSANKMIYDRTFQ